MAVHTHTRTQTHTCAKGCSLLLNDRINLYSTPETILKTHQQNTAAKSQSSVAQ